MSHHGMDFYTVSADGQLVGHDGFVVPKDFDEFYERYPRHVRGFVRRHLSGASRAEWEDRESELLLHLMTLPEDSKFRAPSFNGYPMGCKDRIQVFHPTRAYGASASRFFWYVNCCLRNHLYSCVRTAMSNPVCRASTIGLDSPIGADGGFVNDEYIFTQMARGVRNQRHLLEERVLVDEFIAFIRRHNPELASVLHVISETGSYVEAQRALGMTDRFFLRALNRLRALSSAFERGEKPPQQRKIYRARRSGQLDKSPSTRDNAEAQSERN
ncbi:MAG: hypothetical protein WCC26_21065 [Terracidiphilus sp.]